MILYMVVVVASGGGPAVVILYMAMVGCDCDGDRTAELRGRAADGQRLGSGWAADGGGEMGAGASVWSS